MSRVFYYAILLYYIILIYYSSLQAEEGARVSRVFEGVGVAGALLGAAIGIGIGLRLKRRRRSENPSLV